MMKEKVYSPLASTLNSNSQSDSSSLSPSLGGFHFAAFLTLPLQETPGDAECRFR